MERYTAAKKKMFWWGISYTSSNVNDDRICFSSYLFDQCVRSWVVAVRLGAELESGSSCVSHVLCEVSIQWAKHVAFLDICKVSLLWANHVCCCTPCLLCTILEALRCSWTEAVGVTATTAEDDGHDGTSDALEAASSGFIWRHMENGLEPYSQSEGHTRIELW